MLAVFLYESTFVRLIIEEIEMLDVLSPPPT